MDNRQVPSLSTENFISEPLIKLDTLYSYFLASDYSQSSIYTKNITSLKHLFEEHSSDNSALIDSTNDALKTYLLRYFDEVDINVSIDVEIGSLNIAIKVVDRDGVEASLHNTLNIANGKLDTYSAISDILVK